MLRRLMMYWGAAMVDSDNYLVAGDQIIAVPLSVTGRSFQGRILAIEGTIPGRREFIVELDGTHWLTDGTLGLPENLFVFEVCRGDAWVLVPGYLLPEEAAAKVERSRVNTRKRILAKAPLFADQIPVVVASPVEMIERVNADRQESLQREHEAALKSTALRGQVQSLISSEQFSTLTAMRSRYPRSALYGIKFWRDQLQHIKSTGEARIFVAPPPINQSLNIPWIRPDAEVNWESPKGPKKVRILFIGSKQVMVKIVGEPITDYDPREYPYGNTWVEVGQLTPPALEI
jgi:hypothetical protein